MIAPKISVVMSVYSEPLNWIQEAIDSILKQTFADFEFIIINDNPNNKDLNDFLMMNKINDNRIVIINNEKNIGLTKSLNKGLEIARGEYIARMDADDVSLPNRFEKQIDVLDNHKEIGVCGTGIKTFGRIEKIVLHPEKMNEMCLFLDSPIAHPTVMFRKYILEGIGYDENFKVSQDYALWARLYKNGVEFYNIQEVLLNYRYSDVQISTQKKSLQYDLARKIRRDILSFEVLKKDPDGGLTRTLSWDEIEYLKKHLFLSKANKRKFIYYLYLSIQKSVFIKLLRLILSGDILKLPISNSLRIIYYQIKGFDISKF